MDIDRYLIPEFDFSRLDPMEFATDPDVSVDELVSAFKNWRTTVYDDPGYPIEHNRWYCLGFSHRSRCLELLVTVNDDGKYVFTGFKLLEYGAGLL